MLAQLVNGVTVGKVSDQRHLLGGADDGNGEWIGAAGNADCVSEQCCE
ncbi:hypothetical protein [Amycolatopsis sp. NPDC051102]